MHYGEHRAVLNGSSVCFKNELYNFAMADTTWVIRTGKKAKF